MSMHLSVFCEPKCTLADVKYFREHVQEDMTEHSLKGGTSSLRL